MNWPNRISLARIALIVAAGATWLAGAPVAALVMGIVAGLSDYLDGWLARRTGQVSRVGEVLDQVADQLLYCVCLLIAIAEGLSPAWLLPVIARELWVSAIRRMSAEEGGNIPTSRLGKYNAALLGWAFVPLFAAYAGLAPGLHTLGLSMLAAGVALNTLSGLGYTRAWLRQQEAT